MEIVQLTTQDVTKAKPVTTSLIIAEEFEKRHDHVIRDIEELYEGLLIDCGGAPNFGETYYVEKTEYTDVQNKKRPMYLVNEEFFMHLVMGYTGTKARKIKTSFIKAFVFMRQELIAREKTRHIGKSIRHSLTDSIRDHTLDGTNFKKFAYSNYTKLIYKKILGMDVKKAKEKRRVPESGNLRDHLTIEELERVQAMESKIAVFIEMADTVGKDDKEIYQMVKEYLDGKTVESEIKTE